MHLDCDLYSSTKTVLDLAIALPPDAVVLLFDEFFGLSRAAAARISRLEIHRATCRADIGLHPQQRTSRRPPALTRQALSNSPPPRHLPDQVALSSARYRYRVARLTPRYLAMSFPV